MSRRDLQQALERLRASGRAYAIATVVRTVAPTSAKPGDRALFDGEKITGGWVGGGCALGAVRKHAAAAMKDGRPRLVRVSRDLDRLESSIIGHPMSCPSGGTLDIFIEPVMPRPSLVIVGKTATAQALCKLAAALDYSVTVAAPGIDRDDFDGAELCLDDIDDVADLGQPPEAVVVATQGAGDAKGLAAALDAGAGYVGFIASRKKGARLKETLKQRGCAGDAVDSIEAPAGLDIGARTPEEIALSILAEIIGRRAGVGAHPGVTGHEQSEAG